MHKRFKAAERRPVAGQKVPLVVTRLVEAPEPQPEVKRGKLNYMVKSKPPVPVKKVGTTRHIVRRDTAAGQYLGEGERLIAFVWLDEESAPKEAAANDER